MVSKYKVSPERFRHLAKLIHIATKTQDWHSLKRYDLQLRELLTVHKPYLKDANFVAVIADVKAEHKLALEALDNAIGDMETGINVVNAQHERAKAYQLAMNLES
ncbi:glycogen/starch/alpha-glucan phosphorylase [Vibrio pectenicida]|uniref:Glycogen/starch/alpha-glucan phosphorylase n=1 Tax=Vibrio pectenicida TaxID=62763 RepID=A0A7Y4A2G8_9VIBR|nr:MULTISPECIES: LafD [Vibrio]MBU2898636.1 LafD [Vibrio hepatarius]NOH73333.1 glycogen/starch/alpha-glucan phosphorylase [Vibrio pectenicida]